MEDNKKERNTKQKKLIIDCMKNSEGAHLTVEDIYDIIRDSEQQVSIATIYRNLRLLEEQGIVKKIYVAEGSNAYYELDDNNLPHAHHHLICRRCGTIIDFEEDLLESLEKVIEETRGFSIEDHRVIFYGVCKECKALEQEEGKGKETGADLCNTTR